MAMLSSCTYQFDRTHNITKARLIKKFSCDMTVPAYSDLIDVHGTGNRTFYWPGLAPAASGGVIQPVLAIFNTNKFTQMRVYTVTSEDGYSHTDWGYTEEHGYNVMPEGHVHVEPGTVLNAFIEYVGKDPNDSSLYVYKAGFSNTGLGATIRTIKTHQPYPCAQICVEPYGAKTLTSQFQFSNVNIEYSDEYVPSGYYPDNDNSNGWHSDNGEITISGSTATFRQHIPAAVLV